MRASMTMGRLHGSSGGGSNRAGETRQGGGIVRVLILTTCTGQKAAAHDRALTLRDFRRGSGHVAAREAELAALLTPAEQMYTGQQHVRLMRGIRALRAAPPSDGAPGP